jgi:uncharacterized membrane protein YcaP (DUF421 family)
MVEFFAYITRCVFMFLVTWAGVRLLGRKSIANMTSYDLTAMMLLTTIAAEPIVFKSTSKATIGVATITIMSILIALLSLKEFFINLDAKPVILIANGKILKSELKKVRMNIPLLMSELRTSGYQDLSDIAYAILEANGKLSTIPVNQCRPLQPSDMGIATTPLKLSYPIIIDGKLKEENLRFTKKDKNWLLNQLKNIGVSSITDVLIAQIDSSGNIYIDLKEKNVNLPDIE